MFQKGLLFVKKGFFRTIESPSISESTKMYYGGVLCLDNILGNCYKIYKLNNLGNQAFSTSSRDAGRNIGESP